METHDQIFENQSSLYANKYSIAKDDWEGGSFNPVYKMSPEYINYLHETYGPVLDSIWE